MTRQQTALPHRVPCTYSWAAREAATRGLIELGPPAEALLRQARAANPSAEASERLDRILKELDRYADAPPVRCVRALEALERAGTAEAQRVAAAVADRMPDAPLGREARATSERMRAARK